MSMAYIAIGTAILSVVGTGVSVYGQQQQKKAVEQTAKYNTKVAQGEASKQNRVATENIKRASLDNRRLRGQLASANAANGFTMEGTPLAVLGETQTALERDILDIGYQAAENSRSILAGTELGKWSAQQQSRAITTQQYATAASGIGSAAGGYLSSSGKI